MDFNSFKFDNRILTIVTRMGYKEPTPIQEQAIGPILTGRDLLGLAQTGTGKTAAFSLPILQNLIGRKSRVRKPKVLILSPTRELVDQTAGYLNFFSRKLQLFCGALYGGVSRCAQVKQLSRGVDIVVACPGRLLDLAGTKDVDLSAIDILVLDEADQMLDRGFLPDIRKIIKLLPETRQNLVFSATMPGEVKSLVEGLLKNPLRIAIDYELPKDSIRHSLYWVENNKKRESLNSVLRDKATTQAIVFTRTKFKAKSLARQLEEKGFSVTSIQGNLNQNKRQEALNGFKNGKYKVLVATDIAARGIDIAGISHVINYDMPANVDAYVHRIGRTGRAGKSGQAITFATGNDKKMVQSLGKIFNEKMSCTSFNGAENVPQKDKKESVGVTSSPVKWHKDANKRKKKKILARREMVGI